jgi:hypothetical protein
VLSTSVARCSVEDDDVITMNDLAFVLGSALSGEIPSGSAEEPGEFR